MQAGPYLHLGDATASGYGCNECDAQCGHQAVAAGDAHKGEPG